MTVIDEQALNEVRMEITIMNEINDQEITLHKILEEFQKDCSEVGGSALLSTDGFVITSTLPADLNGEMIGAIAASTLKIGAESIREFGKRDLQQILIKGKQGFVILRKINSMLALLVLAKEKSKLGLLFNHIKETAARIANAS